MNHRILFSVLFFVSIFTHSGVAQEMLTLEQAIQLALEKNYDVKIARRNAEAAETDNAYALGAFLPQVNGTASATWTDTDQEFKFADETRNTSGNAESNNMSASVQLVWTLFDGTRMFATRERIEQLARQGDLLVKDQMVNTIASVVANYFDIVRQKQQLRAIQEQMSVNEERVKLAERKLQVGTGAKPELLQAKVDLNAQKTTALQQEALIIQLKEQLNVLLGMQLKQFYEVADSIAINTSINREEILGKVTTSNFSILAAERSVAITNLSVRERQAERFPVINFNAAYNFNHNDNTKLINPFSSVQSENRGINYGVSLSLPLLNGFNASRLIKQATISLNRQSILLDQQRATTNIAATNAYVAYQNGIQILAVEEENILLAKENVTIALESFKRGVSTFIELRTAQQSLETAYNRLITARYNAKVAETELLRLSGALLK
jgi:outer membrane protein